MSAQTPVEIPAQQQEEKRLIPTLYVGIGVAAVLVLAGLFIWGAIWLARTQAGSLETVRDIFIIALALETCVFGIVLMLLLIMVVRLVNMLEFEIKPILQKTSETVGMVRGTSVFVSRNVVKPVTTASSYIAGIRRGLRALFGNPKKLLRD